MKSKKVLLLFMFSLLLSSCDSYFKNLKGTDFYVGWVNTESEHVYYQDPSGDGFHGLSEGKVIDVFWNDTLIVAKCSKGDAYEFSIIKIRTSDIENDWRPYEVIGPMAKKEYLSEKQRMGINVDGMNKLRDVGYRLDYERHIPVELFLIISPFYLLLKRRFLQSAWYSCRRKRMGLYLLKLRNRNSVSDMILLYTFKVFRIFYIVIKYIFWAYYAFIFISLVIWLILSYLAIV